MRLNHLLNGVSFDSRLPGSTEITGIHNDSRTVQPGGVFFAVRGFREDGKRYIPQAVNRGAVAVISEEKTGYEDTIPHIYVPDVRSALSRCAINWYSNPAENLHVTAITGTNGKTTTAFLLYKIFSQAGVKAGLLGTLGYSHGNHWETGVLTTPDPLTTQKKLSEFRKNGVTHVVMEVSSHAIQQKRVEGLAFDICVYTNLSQDHLDYHRSMDDYAAVKSGLFKQIVSGGYAVINFDDLYHQKMVSAATATVMGYGLHNAPDKREIFWEDLTIREKGISGTIRCREEQIPVLSPLTGEFNAYNILAAAGVASLTLRSEIIRKAIPDVDRIPGRFDKIYKEGNPLVIIDYAHTPGAMHNILSALARMKKQGSKLIVVFGCGGDRDREKRPLMGKTAHQFGDLVVLTTDNPRSEDPMNIINMARAGMESEDNLHIEVDRRRAIQYAMEHAGVDDIVAILGKGHETYQEIRGVRYPLDDRKIVSAIIGV